MDAIILAAGRGSRMKGLTQNKPKCFVELGGKTLLEWQIEALEKSGISSITIVNGYCKEAFQSIPYPCLENFRWAETNMVSSLLCAQTILREKPCVISYADIVYHPEIIKILKKSEHSIAITYDQKWEIIWEQRFKNPLDDAETFDVCNGMLKAIGDKPSSYSQVNGQYMGLLKVTPCGWNQVEKVLSTVPEKQRDLLDMTSLLKLLLNVQIPIGAVPIQGKWCEVDREEDLKLYMDNLKKIEWLHDWRF